MKVFALVIAASCFDLVSSHGAVVNPPSRNAVDKSLKPWSGPVPAHPPSVESMTGWCPVPDTDGTVSGKNGQACFWFSNGCSLGCAECDGSSRGPIPNSKNPNNHCDPTAPGKCRFNTCGNTTVKATICDPELRTVNTDAECGSSNDWYYYSPWRAPGSAPVFDSCGMAGGHHPPQGSYGGIYVNTTNAKLGDKGSEVLPQLKSGTTWKAGSVVEVSWTIEANHGGGYLYRLAPIDAPLTEETFNKIPLEFVGQQRLRWGGVSGHVVSFDGTYVSEGTVPSGSKWVKNPIPRNDFQQTGKGFEPHCNQTEEYRCEGMQDGAEAQPNLEIVDYVKIPNDLEPGEYVLGWRWDCEESNQIWQSCSDVEIISS